MTFVTLRMSPGGISLLLDDCFSQESPPFLLCAYYCFQNNIHCGIQCVITDATALLQPYSASDWLPPLVVSMCFFFTDTADFEL